MSLFLPTIMPMTSATKKGNNAGSLISGSLIPLLRIVALIATQSDRVPPMARPTSAPISAAKFANPTFWADQRKGGAARACDCVIIRIRREFAAKFAVTVAQNVIGKNNIVTGVTKCHQSSLMAFRSTWWIRRNWLRCGRPWPIFGLAAVQFSFVICWPKSFSEVDSIAWESPTEVIFWHVTKICPLFFEFLELGILAPLSWSPAW